MNIYDAHWLILLQDVKWETKYCWIQKKLESPCIIPSKHINRGCMGIFLLFPILCTAFLTNNHIEIKASIEIGNNWKYIIFTYSLFRCIANVSTQRAHLWKTLHYIHMYLSNSAYICININMIIDVFLSPNKIICQVLVTS